MRISRSVRVVSALYVGRCNRRVEEGRLVLKEVLRPQSSPGKDMLVGDLKWKGDTTRRGERRLAFLQQLGRDPLYSNLLHIYGEGLSQVVSHLSFNPPSVL